MVDISLDWSQSEYENYVCECWDELVAPDLQVLLDILSGIESGLISTHDSNNLCYDWIKKTILLLFKHSSSKFSMHANCVIRDKLGLAYQDNKELLAERNIRLVAGSIVRSGVYLGKNVIIMPSTINIGAHIGDNTMIDMQAVIGSCAYIGKNCHIAMHAGVGGVLEPIQANSTVISDNCFIGAGSRIMEGVVIEKGVVVAAGVTITKSTKIYDKQTGSIIYANVPENAVVVPGYLPSEDNSPSVQCVIISHYKNKATENKVAMNQVLRKRAASNNGIEASESINRN